LSGAHLISLQLKPKLIHYMSSDGEVVRTLVQSPLYFLFARLLMFASAEYLFDRVPSVKLWLARCLFAQQQLLETYAATLHDQMLSFMEQCKSIFKLYLIHPIIVLGHAIVSSMSLETRARLQIESGIQRHFFREITAAKVLVSPGLACFIVCRHTLSQQKTFLGSPWSCRVHSGSAPSSKQKSLRRFEDFAQILLFNLRFSCISLQRPVPRKMKIK
jgi:hypothetical protein